MTYAEALQGQTTVIVRAVTERITVEITKVDQPHNNSTMFLQGCFNILKQATQHKGLMQKNSDAYEQILMPVFECMTDVTKITFEDDICVILKNFIRKTSSISDIIFKVFPCLENVFVKNKHCFGDTLLDTINYYLIYGRDRIMQERSLIEMLFRITD